MITVTCACGAQLRVKDDLVGKKGRCPRCSQIIVIQEDIELAESEIPHTAISAASGGKETRACPGCGARIAALSFSCEFCGASISNKSDHDGTVKSGSEGEGGDNRPLGNSVEELVDDFSRHVSKASVDFFSETDSDAKRCEAVLVKLRVYATKDANLRHLVDDLQRQFHERLIKSKKENRWLLVVVIAVMAVIVCMAVANFVKGWLKP